MRIIKRTITCICVMFTLSSLSHAKEWRSIMPLYSTRDDVIRLLGPSSDANALRSKYHLDKEEVYIVFSTKDVCVANMTKVPIGTVLLIQITPKIETRLTNYQIDNKRFRKFDPSSPANMGYEAQIDNEEGIIFRTFNGTVDKIAYIAAAKDRHLCPDYYANPEQFVQILIDSYNRKFDEYFDMPFSDEKARLDNFAIYLRQDEPEAIGYVIVYAGRRTYLGEAQLRAGQAKQYLVHDRGIKAERIVAIDGGHREKLVVELYALSRFIPAPSPTPTVDPREVEIIKVNNTRTNIPRSTPRQRKRRPCQ